MKRGQQEADNLYKSHFGKMVTSMLHFSRDINFETAEDLVQDSFVAALTAWENSGVPDNPVGWIYSVCRNKALNKIKKNKISGNPVENNDLVSAEVEFPESFFDDQQLRLLFACAHPHLSPKVQVSITLKYVINLKVESIARVLGMTIDGVDKLLLRARQRIKMENVFLKEPSLAALQSRVPVVHKILYLIFNEGYKASSGKEILREELCEESLLMTKALLESRIGDHNTAALYALMLFNAARLKARFNHSGALLDLEEQDRSLWDSSLVELGRHYLKQSRGEPISSYHYEAAIAYQHCSAKSFHSTDWLTITHLYGQLLQNNSNPFIELNYAIAMYYSGQKQEAFILLDQLRNTFLNQYYLLNATLGKLHLLEGEQGKGEQYLSQALELTNFQVEKDFIQKMMRK